MPRFPTPSPHMDVVTGSVFAALAGRLAHAKGETYPLHIGDTWRSPPNDCRMDALPDALVHRYVPIGGIPALLRLIQARVQTALEYPIDIADLCVTSGATGGLHIALAALLKPGDEVIIPAPFWPLIAGIVRVLGGVPVLVPFFQADGSCDVHAIRTAITARTVALYINTPNNPTGRIAPLPLTRMCEG